MKKLLTAIALVSLFSPLFALAAPLDLEITHRNNLDTTDVPQNISPSVFDTGVYSIPAFRGGGYDLGTPYGDYGFIMAGSGIGITSNTIYSTINTIETSDGHLSDTLSILSGGISSLNSSVSYLLGTVGGFGAPINIPAFMGNNASTSPFIASSTQNGFLSATDKVKLDTLATPAAGTSTRSIVTGTGATGFQISATRPTNDCYSVTVVSGSTLLTPVYGYVALEIASTNSATSSAWTEIGRTGGGDTVGLLHTGTATGQLCGFVPAGDYVKLRSINVAGTATYSYNSGQEVIW